MLTFILSVSVLLQLATGVVALRLQRLTGRNWAWILIALGFLGMAFRRWMSFLQQIAHTKTEVASYSLNYELLGLVTSLCMFAGVLMIKSLLERVNRLHDEEVSHTEERSRLILGAVGDGVVGMDNDGRITFVNPAVPLLVGYSEEELIGEQMHSKLHYAYPDGREFPVDACPMYLTATDGQPRKIDNEVLWRCDGAAIPVEYSTTPVRKDNKIVGSVMVFRDISDRKRAENELKDRMDELERFSRLTINREEKMIQLKGEINLLLEQSGKEKKYKVVD